jgi:NAD(P)-dependent dehydrogenase (short-subunit alcohol dehydrogenase family)
MLVDIKKPLGLVTNANGFAGPAAVDSLIAAGFHVLAHDQDFQDQGVWLKFSKDRGPISPLSCSDPQSIIKGLKIHNYEVKVVISNDHTPAPAFDPVTAPIDNFRLHFQTLMQWPFELIRGMMPLMGSWGGGNIVMITSNRMRLPLSGGAFADAARAGANAMMASLARDCAPYQICLNAIAPNFLYSEAYYPRALFKESEIGKAYINSLLPLGRLAEPEEIGEVITFLATVKTRFLTGAIIEFSGGWPHGPSRPTLKV